jgi:hypothetical protein
MILDSRDEVQSVKYSRVAALAGAWSVLPDNSMSLEACFVGPIRSGQ